MRTDFMHALKSTGENELQGSPRKVKLVPRKVVFLFSCSQGYPITAALFVLHFTVFLLNRTGCFHCVASLGLSVISIKIAIYCILHG